MVLFFCYTPFTLYKLFIRRFHWLTCVEPVKATLLMSGWWAMACPAVGPYPGTTLTTPAGKPAWQSIDTDQISTNKCHRKLNTKNPPLNLFKTSLMVPLLRRHPFYTLAAYIIHCMLFKLNKRFSFLKDRLSVCMVPFNQIMTKWSSRHRTSFMSRAMWRAVRGVCSAGLMTTVFPQHRAGAIFHANIISGKFHFV